MSLRIIFFLLFPAMLTRSLMGAIERTVERTFAAPERGVVVVDSFFGTIQIRSHDAPEVKVIVHESLDAKTEPEADRQLKELDLVIENSAPGRVSVRAQTKKSIRWVWDRWPPVGLTIEIYAPNQSDFDLVAREGSIMVGNFHGSVRARTLQGPVFVGEITGPLTVTAQGGDVGITACSDRLSVTAQSGNVVIGRALGVSELSASGGAVEVQTVTGSLKANTNGTDLKVGFGHPLHGDSELHASGGDISVSFDAKSAATLDAHSSSFGKVTARDLSLKVRVGATGASHLEADLNGGGPRVQINASGGNVRLLGVPAMAE